MMPKSDVQNNAIVQAFFNQNIWVNWRLREVDGKWRKPPIDPQTGNPINITNPNNWQNFKSASKNATLDAENFIGIVLTNGLTGIDLDHVRDPESGEINEEAQRIINLMDSYTEISPSGTGIHILCLGKKPGKHCKRAFKSGMEFEIYDENRYLTFTGEVIQNVTPKDRQKEINMIYDEIFKDGDDIIPHTPPVDAVKPSNDVETMTDNELWDYMFSSKNGADIRLLYDGDLSKYDWDDSRGDQALCNHLAFYLGNNPERIDRMFRQSALNRDDKWCKRKDYRDRTISKAINGNAGLFNTFSKDEKREYAKRKTIEEGGTWIDHHTNNQPVDAVITTTTGGVDELKARFEKLYPEDTTDAGQSDVFISIYGNSIRFVRGIGWLLWDGMKWDSNPVIYDKIKSSMKKLAKEQFQLANELAGIAEGNDKKAEEMRKFARRYRDNGRINGAIALVQSDLSINVIRLDTNPEVLNTPSGIINLSTGEVKPHDPKAYCTKITGCGIHPTDEQREIWRRFLSLIMEGDLDMVDYLQQIAGMFSIGKVYEEKLVIAYGEGGNGKSTFFNALIKTLGDYAGTISSDLIATKPNFNRNLDPEKGLLRGKRLVIAGELEEGTFLNEKRVKEICSTDEIAVNPKHKDPFTFVPSHSTVLHTNHLPDVKAKDKGTWDRLIVIPFDATLRGADIEIKDYADVLFHDAGEAILEWIIEGAKIFTNNNHRVSEPDAIRKMIFDYKNANNNNNNQNNHLYEWIEERCVQGVGEKAKASELYADYQTWMTATQNVSSGVDLTSTGFGRKLGELGFSKTRTKSGIIRNGLSLV